VLRRAFTVVAIDGDGRETELGRRFVVEASAHERWAFVAARGVTLFRLVPALSGIAIGSAEGLSRRYEAYLSQTTGIAMRVPILYLRTTRGASGDYAFDPDFDVRRRQGERAIADDALAPLLA
jgi:hypothetical protein